MTDRKPLVVVTRKLPEKVEARMRELFDVRLNETDVPMTADELKSALKDVEVFVPTVTDSITADVLSGAGPDLKLIANYGAGVDHIDLTAARERGLIVTNTPGALTDDTADMTLALILAVPRRLSESERFLRAGNWRGWAPTFMLGRRIKGKRLGIIGMGRIGRAVAERARAFGLEIHYHNRSQLPENMEETLDATYWDSLDKMLPHMDIISINCPHTPNTHHLLNARTIGLLQRHTYVVNTSRGGVIDESALIAALESGAISGAGLDVYENEPDLNPALFRLSNVEMLPHMGSATIEGRVEMGEMVIINIKTWVDGHRPPDRVYGELY